MSMKAIHEKKRKRKKNLKGLVCQKLEITTRVKYFHCCEDFQDEKEKNRNHTAKATRHVHTEYAPYTKINIFLT